MSRIEPTSPSRRVARALGPVLLLAAMGCWGLGVHRIDPTTLGGLGLAPRLSPLIWAGLVLLVAAAVAELARAVRTSVMAGVAAAAVVQIYGLQALTYGAARLPIGWLHVGFATQIADHGEVVHYFDTRFSWPGFFTTAAMWSEAAGFDTAEPLIKWAPVVLIGLAVVPTYALATAFLGRGRGAWIATLLCIGGDWTEQEYFSPQGLAYVLLLAALAVAAHALCTPLTERRTERRPWRRHHPATPPGDRIAAQIVVVIIAAALAASHQLTPFVLAMFLAVFWLCGRLAPGWLPLVALALPCAWFVLGAQEFWNGQLAMLLEGAGNLSSSINQGIAGRLGGAQGHEFMVLGRIGLSGLFAVAFAVALWRGRRLLAAPLLLLTLVVAAFGMAAVQPYGGEIFMRCYLFALPWFAIGIGGWLGQRWDASARPHRWAAATAALLAAVILATVTVRGGNDAFVAYETADVEAVQVADARARPEESVIAPLWYAPLRLERVGDVTQLSTFELQTPTQKCLTEDEIYHCIVDNQATYVVLTPAQEKAGEILSRFGAGWLDRLRGRLEAAGYAVVYDRDGRVVLAAAGN